jgi:2,5-diamino-6-(ribosylamino)-4(3H)-pyrimidinone 5'-phosphate reductase
MSYGQASFNAPQDEAEAFLRPLIPSKKPYSHRPFVTLTYAQSLDGKISGKEGSGQLILSGKESKQMTHR